MNEDMNMEYFSTINDDGFDITVYQCGMEKCKKLHSYGPAIRDHYLIHFVLEGSGIFYVGGKSYRIKKIKAS